MVTTAGNLPAKFVIHTVGPVWNGGKNGEREKLANCYHNSLQPAVDNNCSSIAFPNINTGVYRFPKEEAAKIAVTTVHSFLKNQPQIQQVLFVCFDQESFDLIQAELARVNA